MAEVGEQDPSPRLPWVSVLLRSSIVVVAIAVAARVSIPLPGTPVPQSLQTLAVVLAGTFLGARAGALAVTAYVVVGALGMPVFADGASGPAVLLGPTGGYLAGFVLGAALCGAVAAPAHRLGGGNAEGGVGPAVSALLVARVTGGALAAHTVILGAGWLRLSVLTTPADAWAAGVAPFLGGALVKSVAAGLIWGGARAARPPQPQP